MDAFFRNVSDTLSDLLSSPAQVFLVPTAREIEESELVGNLRSARAVLGGDSGDVLSSTLRNVSEPVMNTRLSEVGYAMATGGASAALSTLVPGVPGVPDVGSMLRSQVMDATGLPDPTVGELLSNFSSPFFESNLASTPAPYDDVPWEDDLQRLAYQQVSAERGYPSDPRLLPPSAMQEAVDLTYERYASLRSTSPSSDFLSATLDSRDMSDRYGRFFSGDYVLTDTPARLVDPRLTETDDLIYDDDDDPLQVDEEELLRQIRSAEIRQKVYRNSRVMHGDRDVSISYRGGVGINKFTPASRRRRSRSSLTTTLPESYGVPSDLNADKPLPFFQEAPPELRSASDTGHSMLYQIIYDPANASLVPAVDKSSIYGYGTLPGQTILPEALTTSALARTVNERTIPGTIGGGLDPSNVTANDVWQIITRQQEPALPASPDYDSEAPGFLQSALLSYMDDEDDDDHYYPLGDEGDTMLATMPETQRLKELVRWEEVSRNLRIQSLESSVPAGMDPDEYLRRLDYRDIYRRRTDKYAALAKATGSVSNRPLLRGNITGRLVRPPPNMRYERESSLATAESEDIYETIYEADTQQYSRRVTGTGYWVPDKYYYADMQRYYTALLIESQGSSPLGASYRPGKRYFPASAPRNRPYESIALGF